MGRTIEVVASFDDNYAQHAAVMMASLLKHTSRNVAFHFLVTRITSRSRARLERLANAHGSTVSFHLVDERAFGNVQLGNLVVHTYFRLLIPALLRDKSRVLYLDVDVVVSGDVGELFDVDLGREKIAAVTDPGVDAEFIARASRDGRKYFNSGVLVMAVDRMSPADTDEWLQYAREQHSQIVFHDQCLLNRFLGFKEIPPRFNLMSQFLLPYADLPNKGYSFRQIAEARARPTVIHYNTYFGKPWEHQCTHPLKKEYLRCLLSTPWRWNAVRIVAGQTAVGLRNRLRLRQRLRSLYRALHSGQEPGR